MEFEFAPMEGLTTYIYRNTFHEFFGGIDTYYAPFLSNPKMNYKEVRDILPENNEGIKLIPQILTNKPDIFLLIAKELAKYGYKEVNLNLGCPSGTVVGKKRGAGFLSVPDELRKFLSEIYEYCESDISIKTRIGIEDEEEWEHLLDIYKDFPVKKLIVHTRLLKDKYKHPARPLTFQKAVGIMDAPLCYNGDITSEASFNDIEKLYGDSMDAVMIGRGLASDPNLIRRLTGQSLADKSVYAEFVQTLLDRYTEQLAGGNKVILFKMKEIWVYLYKSFDHPDKYFKMIKKSIDIDEYKIAVKQLFHNCDLVP